jgi:hypothetical protein
MLPSTQPSTSYNEFEIQGLIGGQYLLRFSVVGGAVVSIKSGDGEFLYKPFDGSAGRDYDIVVTVTDKRTDLSGIARDARGALVENAIVLAFPVEREQWTNYGLSPARLKGSPLTSAGTYRFQSLPAGIYYVVGVPPDQGDVWQDPEKLAQLVTSAARVTLVWGETTTQNVTVVRVK